MPVRKTDLIRANIAENRKLRRQMNDAGEQVENGLRRLAGGTYSSAKTGRYVTKSSGKTHPKTTAKSS